MNVTNSDIIAIATKHHSVTISLIREAVSILGKQVMWKRMSLQKYSQQEI